MTNIKQLQEENKKLKNLIKHQREFIRELNKANTREFKISMKYLKMVDKAFEINDIKLRFED